MKVLKIVAGIILLVIVGFFLIGFFSPRVSYENRITVNKPAGVAWQVFTDTTLMDRWLTGYQSMETLEGEPMNPGSSYKIIMEMEGERMELTEYVTAVDSARLFAFDLESDVLSSQNMVRFVPVDSATTEIVATSYAEGKGWIWRSIISMSASMMEQQGQQTYDNLKELIESQPDTLLE